MDARSYIVRGKGNVELFESCWHGTDRATSRSEARRRFTLANHPAATEGLECLKDKTMIDAAPATYKNVDAAMEALRDLANCRALAQAGDVRDGLTGGRGVSWVPRGSHQQQIRAPEPDGREHPLVADRCRRAMPPGRSAWRRTTDLQVWCRRLV